MEKERRLLYYCVQLNNYNNIGYDRLRVHRAILFYYITPASSQSVKYSNYFSSLIRSERSIDINSMGGKWKVSLFLCLFWPRHDDLVFVLFEKLPLYRR